MSQLNIINQVVSQLTEAQKAYLSIGNKVLIIFRVKNYKIYDINEEDVGDWWEQCLYLKQKNIESWFIITRIGFGFNATHNLYQYFNKDDISLII
jgi:hypothetical protein